ncbi:hypothetical protein HNY73_011690 [Argiope bruennichi]|uniref:Uncharacterized protein n=1 Tax=Argiope bruennichi TaxID=94029 RepID=A0A8T0F3T4_ARGBR|nr:hypothetical protein HNY73_011690 [Argiope bruennichi]
MRPSRKKSSDRSGRLRGTVLGILPQSTSSKQTESSRHGFRWPTPFAAEQFHGCTSQQPDSTGSHPTATSSYWPRTHSGVNSPCQGDLLCIVDHRQRSRPKRHIARPLSRGGLRRCGSSRFRSPLPGNPCWFLFLRLFIICLKFSGSLVSDPEGRYKRILSKL